jgi:hypothetical protein
MPVMCIARRINQRANLFSTVLLIMWFRIAGVMATPEMQTAQGFEYQLGKDDGCTCSGCGCCVAISPAVTLLCDPCRCEPPWTFFVDPVADAAADRHQVGLRMGNRTCRGVISDIGLLMMTHCSVSAGPAGSSTSHQRHINLGIYILKTST